MEHQTTILPDGRELVLIHFTYRTSDTDPWVIACTPGMDPTNPKGNFPWKRTNDPRVANCPTCCETPEYRESARQHGMPERPSLPVRLQEPVRMFPPIQPAQQHKRK